MLDARHWTDWLSGPEPHLSTLWRSHFSSAGSLAAADNRARRDGPATGSVFQCMIPARCLQFVNCIRIRCSPDVREILSRAPGARTSADRALQHQATPPVGDVRCPLLPRSAVRATLPKELSFPDGRTIASRRYRTLVENFTNELGAELSAEGRLSRGSRAIRKDAPQARATGLRSRLTPC